MSRHPDQYNMGHTRAHHFPNPQTIRFTEHNGRTIVANPAGVPAKWLPIYAELASRMYDGGPSFAIGKDEKKPGNPVTLRLRDECGGWSTYADPIFAAQAVGIAPIAPVPKPPAPKTRVVHPGSGVPAYRELAAKPAVPATSSSLPDWAEEWLAGLVFEAKRDYARQFLEHLLCGADAPADPATEWAGKARKRAHRLMEMAA